MSYERILISNNEAPTVWDRLSALPVSNTLDLATRYGRDGTVTNFSGDMPSASAWKLTTTRWLNTGTAIAFTSSKSGTERPSIAARAFAPRMRYCDARGPAPQLTYFLTSGVASSEPGRVDRASFTA